MEEYELDNQCQHTICDCDCIHCPLFAKYMSSENE